MPTVDVLASSPLSTSTKARQIEALFDVPPRERSELRWQGEIPLEKEPWGVGLIVGPSGSGKSTIARHLFGAQYHPEMEWGAPSVLDDVRASAEETASAFSSVGFNTIPAWLRPYSVLSNGERFRADIARRLVELEGTIVVDEFTSVVDRQVAQIACHAIQKYVRRASKRFVAISCHHDIEDWLQPDWVFEPAQMLFRRRRLRRRPELQGRIARVDRSLWRLFAPFHYLTAHLPGGAHFAAFIDDRPVCFCGTAVFPHARAKDIQRISRLVTLPDWQGLGLAFVLCDTLGGAYRALGRRLRMYPAHSSLVRAFDRSSRWRLIRPPGQFASPPGAKARRAATYVKNRACAVFEYAGDALPLADARALVEGDKAERR